MKRIRASNRGGVAFNVPAKRAYFIGYSDHASFIPRAFDTAFASCLHWHAYPGIR